MSRTFKLLNASGKHVHVIHLRFKAIIIIEMHTHLSVYICVCVNIL